MKRIPLTIRQYRTIKSSLIIFLVIMIILFSYICLIMYQKSRYVCGIYDCKHMSKDCEIFFEMMGFNTKILLGYNPDNNSNGHCWLLIETAIGNFEFESTDLTFKNVSKDWIVYDVNEGFIKR